MEINKTPISFAELIGQFKVVIPRLQRDYAYGRVNENEKRENFLANLRKYLIEERPHELDFIYGSIKDGELILLDGQQRITTLFLLHWYFSLIVDQKGKHNFDEFHKMVFRDKEIRFSYKTRYSSEDFCKKIVCLDDGCVEKYSRIINGDLLLNNTNYKEGILLSDIIKNEKWFHPHWKCDPTIISMLNMIDAFCEFFSPNEFQDGYQKLIKGDIQFYFLNLPDYKLTDELYIKMNSRGRPLTRFENLKSILLKLYEEAEKKDLMIKERHEEKLKSINDKNDDKKNYDSLREYVSRMIDGRWTDVFWKEKLSIEDQQENDIETKKTIIADVDDMMLSFISSMAIFDHILAPTESELSIGHDNDRIKKINTLIEACSDGKILIRYDTFSKLFEENNYAFLVNIIDYFNIYIRHIHDKLEMKESFVNDAFKSLTSDYKDKNPNYEGKAKTFAYFRFLYHNPEATEEDIKEWMRFACNVCSNSYTLPNSINTFCNAIEGLNYLIKENKYKELAKKSSIQDEIDKIKTLDKLQIKEEVLKIQLSQDPDWKKELDAAENSLKYFEGRLRYPLIECAGVESKDSATPEKLEKFRKYVAKIASIFEDENGCNCENELVRAMLSKGDYLMKFSSGYSLLKNKGRDNSWRRFLKEPYFRDDEIDRRECFKAVIDDDCFSDDTKDVKTRLEQIARSRDDSIPFWRKMIIDHPNVMDEVPGVFRIGSDRYLRWNEYTTELNHGKDTEDNHEIDLLSGERLSGYHAELFSFCFYLELKAKISFKEGYSLEYKKTKAPSEQPCCCLEKNGRSIFRILYDDVHDGKIFFRLVFLDENREEQTVPYDEVAERIVESYGA